MSPDLAYQKYYCLINLMKSNPLLYADAYEWWNKIQKCLDACPELYVKHKGPPHLAAPMMKPRRVQRALIDRRNV